MHPTPLSSIIRCPPGEERKAPHPSGGDPGALGLPPSIFMGLRSSSYGTASVPRAMSWGKEGPPLPLVRGEGFRVTSTSRGRPSSDMSPPEPGRRAAKRLFIFRYLTDARRYRSPWLRGRRGETRVLEARRRLTGAGVDVGQQLQVGPQPVEVGGVSGPLQCDRQLLDTLGKRRRRLQL
ncbi:hypothetical protein EYF80_049485 [Liparis tanakae]|uniref:Uncharacterized protein n=1 Tax=Liparis tanakae TaxID=230148 RepID=A0A4Z2FGP1_9TELE|nr:hypothetical protein EYF80_049485 [Liparis tanakae]